MSQSGEGFIVCLIIAIIVYVLVVAGRIIARSGDNGWKVLIPVYGIYLFYKACDSVGIFIGSIIVSVLTSFISSIAARNYSRTGIIVIAIIAGIIELVMSICFSANAACAFGKSTGFAVGIFFLSPIFMGILAFEKRAEGECAARQYARGYDAIPSSGATWRCSQCGESNPVSRLTCQSCGFTK